ncbi:TonB-dependent receptor [Novosphingobium sp.]|uniref:TonB-dependent receptor n=1 Tax=Novosphingobium sp. TaxID=1874826 RepID=UPI0033420871
MRHIHLLLSTSLLGCVLAAQPAFADDAAGAAPANAAPATNDSTIREIIVTAERRFNTAQKTAAAISVRPGDQLLLEGRYELKSILEDVPGISGGASGSTNTSLAGGTDNPATGLVIRGVQSNSGVGGSATSTSSAAAIYVDDVYNGVGGGYDIAQVEVLRGPQGTLYGRSATAGVVAIHTIDPDTKKFGVKATGEIGNYNLYHFVGEVNLPIITDKLALRVSGNYFERDGYYSKLGDARQSTSFRAKLLWKPTDNFSALFGYAQEYNVTHTGGTGVSQRSSPTDFVFNENAVGNGRNHSRQFWGNFNLDLGSVALTYVPAFRTFYQNATAVIRTPPGPGATNIDNPVITTPDDFMTHEIRLHNTDAGAAFKWQVGGMYYRNTLSEINNLFNYDLGPGGSYIFKSSTHKVTTAEGLFAEGTYAFAPDTRLTAGIRYDHTQITIDQNYTSFTGITQSLTGADRKASFDNITYKARLEHDLTPRNLLYAAISTGFSPGDKALTQDPTGQPKPIVLKAETLTSYEIGSKNRFLDNHLQINVAAFYNNYAGYQTAGINVAPPGPIRIFENITTPVKVYGAELEVEARPWQNGTFGLNASYNHARYGDYGAYDRFFSNHTVSPSAPFRLTASYDHRVVLGENAALMLRAAVRYVSAHDSTRITKAQAGLDPTVPPFLAIAAPGATPYIRVPDAAVIDLNGTLVLGSNVSITAYARNLANKRYLPDNWNVATVLKGPTDSQPIVVVSQNTLSDPRTFGLILNVKY